MSFAVWNWLKVYQRWRESYFQKYPQKRLFPWLKGLVPEAPEEPIITLAPRGVAIVEKGKIGMVLVVALVLLALGSSD